MPNDERRQPGQRPRQYLSCVYLHARHMDKKNRAVNGKNGAPYRIKICDFL